MKHLLFTLLILLSVSKKSICQELAFDNPFFSAIDKWVIFKGQNNNHSLGFIYVDPQAGFTFDFYSPVNNTNNQLVLEHNKPLNSIKYRLESNTAPVHILTDQEIKQLKLPKEPEWLKHYNTYQSNIQQKVSLGYAFNHIGQCEIALSYLLEAYDLDPHYQSLEFELAYAYNATGNFTDAIEILQKAIKNNPENFWFYRELGYAYLHTFDIAKATEIYNKALSISQDKGQKAEIAINMAIYFFSINEKASFEKWVKITKENAAANSPLLQYIQQMEDDWDVER